MQTRVWSLCPCETSNGPGTTARGQLARRARLVNSAHGRARLGNGRECMVAARRLCEVDEGVEQQARMGEMPGVWL